MGTDVLRGLSEAQAEAVRDPSLALAVIAGPGAGKTRVLTRRIAWRCRSGLTAPEHTLVLTFSRRAGGELRGRLVSLGLPGSRDGGVVAGTFHAVAWAQICRRRADRGQAPLGLVARAGPLARPALEAALGRESVPGELRMFLDEVAWARRQGAGPSSYPDVAARAGRWPPWAPELVASAWADYARAKQRAVVVDLDDLLDLAATMIEDDNEVAAAVRWRHRHVYVDEYQDLNPVHLRLLRAWVGSTGDVFLVGDPHQAVYGFNGACPDLFAHVTADWPGIHVVRLDEDFRASPELVAFTSVVPEPAARRVSRRPPGPVPALVACTDEQDEARSIARAVWAHHGAGVGWNRMAILARTNSRLRTIATALTSEGVPWRLRDRRPLSDRPAVEAWLHDLPAGAPLPDLGAATDDPDLEALGAALEDYRGQVRYATVAGFRAWLDASGPTEDEPAYPGVELATFHRAKGLEWDAVWVAGVEEGLVPLSFAATSESGLDEERRLLYVALTRAGTELTVSWAGAPSRWAPLLVAAAATCSARPAGDDLCRRLAALRGELGRGREPGAIAARRTAIRQDALRGWRTRRARAAAVPPQTVLPDTVLDALATSSVQTPEEVVDFAGNGGRRVRTWAAEIADALALGQTA